MTDSRPSKTPHHPHAAAIRLLLADGHVIFREGLAMIINQQDDMEVVAEADDATEAVRQWRAHRPHVMLMELPTPASSAANVIHELCEIDRDIRIIVLTTFDGDEDISRAIRAGARSYLVKDVTRRDLLRCIREVHAGRFFIPPEVAAKLARRHAAAELTSREMEVLQLLGSGKPNKLIAIALDIAEVTVKSHVRALFGKLGVLSRTEALATAARAGLIRL